MPVVGRQPSAVSPQPECGTGVPPVNSAVTFQDLVDAELRLARQLYPERQRHLEAAAYIREKFEDYWQAVKVRVLGRDVRPLARGVVQLAAMAQRAAEDLHLAERACGVPLSFADQVTDKVPELRRCLHWPLKTSHAAATWLRQAVSRYEAAVELGVPHKSPQLALEQLVIIAGCCRVVAEDLRYLERTAPGSAKLDFAQPSCPACHSTNTRRWRYSERVTQPKDWLCNSCGQTFFPSAPSAVNGEVR